MTATIGHLKSSGLGYRCDRHSALGNPFAMRTEADRHQVIEGFRRYLWRILQGEEPLAAARAVSEAMGLAIASTARLPTRAKFLESLATLEAAHDPVLLCWCSPRACHCDVIARYLDWRSR